MKASVSVISFDRQMEGMPHAQEVVDPVQAPLGKLRDLSQDTRFVTTGGLFVDSVGDGAEGALRG